MDIIDCIRTRRSIRSYKSVMPDDQDVERILDAARWAPSGLNNQPWRFIVVRDQDRKRKMSSFTKYGLIIRKAPVAIIVCLDTEVSYDRDKDILAVGASIQNMLLEAHSLGLATCWLGEILNKKEELGKSFDIPDTLEIMAVITVGYPDEVPEDPGRKPLSSLKLAL